MLKKFRWSKAYLLFIGAGAGVGAGQKRTGSATLVMSFKKSMIKSYLNLWSCLTQTLSIIGFVTCRDGPFI